MEDSGYCTDDSNLGLINMMEWKLTILQYQERFLRILIGPTGPAKITLPQLPNP